MTILTHLARFITTREEKAHIYLVGGSVRDRILKRNNKDFDLVITGVHQKRLETLLRQIGKVKLVGKAFGVYKWRPAGKLEENKKKEIDIALPRTEFGWGTGRRRDFSVHANPALSIEEDLSRRDFTINAIAYDVLSRRYFDPFHGRADITKKIIRAVGDPEKRFKEDASRMARAIRFAAQLGFTVEPQTWRALTTKAPTITRSAKEILALELIKALAAHPLQTVDLYDKAELWRKLIPEFLEMKKCAQPRNFHTEGDVFTHTKLILQKLMEREKPPYDPHLILAILFHDIGKPVTRKLRHGRITFYGHEKKGVRIASKIFARLTLESAGIVKKHVLWMIQNHMILFNSDPKKMRHTTVERYFANPLYPSPLLLKLIECDARASLRRDGSAPNLSSLVTIKKRLSHIQSKPKKPLLNGNEIMETLGIPPSPRIGEILEAVREAELEGKIHTKEEAKKYIFKNAKPKTQNQQT